MCRRHAPHGLNFSVDLCWACELIWLDNGEIEAIQLAFEESQAGRDVIRRQQEMINMDGARRVALEANIAKAPDRKKNDPMEHRYRGGRYYCGLDLLGTVIGAFFNH